MALRTRLSSVRLKTILLFLPLILCVACQKPPDADAFLKGPYLQNVRPDGITILWESNTPSAGKIEFGKTPDLGMEFTEGDTNSIHEITLNGLEMETFYYYRAVSGDAESESFRFKTSVHEESQFSFIFYGDNKNGPHVHEKNADLILSKKPDFVIHNGDLVDDGTIYRQWELLFFNPTRNLMHSVPLYPVLGNHERHAKYYFDFFSLPGNEAWYSFDYGNAHFIILDSDEDELTAGSEQIDWLIRDLENTDAEWKFISFHYPPFTAGGNYYRANRIKLKNLVHPIFEKYGVDMVFGGHDHNYERSYPIMTLTGKKPITYIVAGNGGTSMRYIGSREWTAYAERVFGFTRIGIDGSKLHLQAYSIDDKVIDELILDKKNPKSVEAYQQRLVFFEDIKDPVEATRLYREGDKLLDKEYYSEALPLFLKAYDIDTTCIEALAGAAECHYQMGNLGAATELAVRGIRKKPNYPDSYEVLIDVFRRQNKFDEALLWSAKWLEIEPDSSDPNETMSEIYADQGKIDLAIREMQNALAAVPSDPKLYLALGKLYERINDRRKALNAYQNALYWHRDAELDEDFLEARDKLQVWSN